MTIQADLEHAHASLTEILSGIEGSLTALHDANGAGYPTKASGAASSPGTIVGRYIDGPEDDSRSTTLTLPERIMDHAQQHRPDPADSDLAQLSKAAADLRRASTRALNVLAKYQRAVPRHTPKADIETPDDWCRSCHRNNQHHTPVSLRPTGEAYYVGLCRWCGDFRKAHKYDVPLEVLRVRHQGKRVTLQLIDTHKPLKGSKRKGKR